MKTDQIARMNQPVFPDIPAGLMDDKIEYFAFGNNVFAQTGGNIIAFENWTERILAFVEADMEKHPEAVECLIDLGLEERLPGIKQYTRCRKGGYDKYADMNENGDCNDVEFWDCGIRGNCDYEGRLCSTFKVKNGVLSYREIQVMQRVYEGLMAKQIADDLNIATSTVNVHIQKILGKTGLLSSAEIVRFASDHNLKRINK